MNDAYDAFDLKDSRDTPLRFKCSNCKGTGWEFGMKSFGVCSEKGCKEGKRRKEERIRASQELRERIKQIMITEE